MALSALTHMQLLAPAYAANANASLYLDQARECLDSTYWDVMWEKAVALLACHTMALSLDTARQNGTAGSIASKSEGGLSISFSGGSGSSDWGQTSFGLQLLRLQSTCGPSLFVTGSDMVGYGT